MQRTRYIPNTTKENEAKIIAMLTEMALATLQRRPRKWKRLDKKLSQLQKRQLQINKLNL